MQRLHAGSQLPVPSIVVVVLDVLRKVSVERFSMAVAAAIDGCRVAHSDAWIQLGCESAALLGAPNGPYCSPV